MLRLLYIHAGIPNYVADSLFHGLRVTNSVLVVDLPRHDVMYKNATFGMLQKTGSRGGCIYGHLPEESDEIASSRVFWQRDLNNYDFIILSDPHHCHAYIDVLRKTFGKDWYAKTIWIDGSDSVSAFPFTSKAAFFSFYSRPFVPILKCIYFKREFLSWPALFGIDRKGQLPIIHKKFSDRRFLKSISISVPYDFIKVISFDVKDITWFPISPDPDLSQHLPDLRTMQLGQSKFVIDNYDVYKGFLDRSKYGIVCKRAGWDSLRIYEYAARGVIICFKDLDLKPVDCAPFGLNSSNCIPFKHHTDLMERISGMSQEELVAIQRNAYEWINNFTTISTAQRFLNAL